MRIKVNFLNVRKRNVKPIQKLLFSLGLHIPVECMVSTLFSSSNLERLLKLQKRAARIILKADFRTPSADVFQEPGLLSVECRMWDLIESVPDHCLSFYFTYNKAVLSMTP